MDLIMPFFFIMNFKIRCKHYNLLMPKMVSSVKAVFDSIRQRKGANPHIVKAGTIKTTSYSVIQKITNIFLSRT